MCDRESAGDEPARPTFRDAELGIARIAHTIHIGPELANRVHEFPNRLLPRRHHSRSPSAAPMRSVFSAMLSCQTCDGKSGDRIRTSTSWTQTTHTTKLRTTPCQDDQEDRQEQAPACRTGALLALRWYAPDGAEGVRACRGLRGRARPRALLAGADHVGAVQEPSGNDVRCSATSGRSGPGP